jgi:hypothetical protein
MVEVAKKILDPNAAVPADDACRNLVAKGEGQYRWMLRELCDLTDDVAADVPRQAAIVEERDVLRPWEADHHTKSVARGFVEQIQPRRRVSADGVDAEARHQTEVLGDLFDRRKLVPVRIGGERTVGHTLDQETCPVAT